MDFKVRLAACGNHVPFLSKWFIPHPVSFFKSTQAQISQRNQQGTEFHCHQKKPPKNIQMQMNKTKASVMRDEKCIEM